MKIGVLPKPKKTKEEIKREKMLNRSMTATASSTQKSMGINAVQSESGVFLLSSGVYLKTFMLKDKLLLDESEREELAMLFGTMGYRVRFTSIYRTMEKGYAVRRFITVQIKAKGYAKADSIFSEIEDLFMRFIYKRLGIDYIVCNVDMTLLQISQNYFFDLVGMDHISSIKKKEDWMKVCMAPIGDEYKWLNISGKFVSTLIGIQFPNEIHEVLPKIRTVSSQLISVVDFEPIGEKEHDDYNQSLTTKYLHDPPKLYALNKSNVTYGVAIVSASEAGISTAVKSLEKITSEKKLILAPCNGYQETAYRSFSTFGISDFRAMRNVSFAASGNLIM